MLFSLKIFILFLSSFLFWWGGFNFNKARRFIMPLILTATCLIFTNFDLRILPMICSIGFLCVGYGDNSFFRKVFQDGWGRGVWGLLVALSLSLSLFLTMHMSLLFFIIYLAINFTLENVLKKLPQSIGDPIIGCGFASILLIIHP